MLHTTNTRTQANNSTLSPASVDETDKSNNLEGLTQMFIGYLLYCNQAGRQVSDLVHATYVNLTFDPTQLPASKQSQYMTVSEYAASKGITGLTSSLASKLGKRAGMSGKILGTSGANRYPVHILEQVFQQI